MALRALIAGLLALLALPVRSDTASPEIEVPGLPEIAITVRDPASPTGRSILIEPVRCAEIGAACRFLILHEHGHAALGHDPRAPSLQKERAADVYAAERAATAAVLAAWDRIRRAPASRLYGRGPDRAQAICKAAQRAGNWVGPPCGG